MGQKIVLTVAALLLSNAALASDLPDPKMTPGAINPEVTQQNTQQTVCVKGFTKTIRPPAYYTNKLKKAQIVEYRYNDTVMEERRPRQDRRGFHEVRERSRSDAIHVEVRRSTLEARGFI